MEIYKIKDLSFKYPHSRDDALKNINISIKRGEFITLCGKSGCGKTTLLRLLKTVVAPFGELSGGIFFCGQELASVDAKRQTAEIGCVMQNPDNQIATDKVWHELAFGLESLGCPVNEIRTRVSEMASFFGIQNWFYKKTSDLSGGQKQLLNLASVMVMQPEVLILDEPTSQLDPIVASEFLKTLQKINDELGITIILTEHRLEEAFAISDRIIVMDDGMVVADDIPQNIGGILKSQNHDMSDALPTPVRVFASTEGVATCPVTIREGREWLLEYLKTHEINHESIPEANKAPDKNVVIEVKEAYFRYDKNLPDVVKNLNLTVNRGEFFAILGGNGTGKTTALSLIAGLKTPQRGEIYINGKKPSETPDLYDGLIGVLPQNPQSLFARKTVYLDLYDMTDKQLPATLRETKVMDVTRICRIEKLIENHAYDLSGGEQQRVALAMLLLRNPRILILDEPTKGMDSHFKKIFADILRDLKLSGTTILMVSHDIEFCAEFADRCAMFFDGGITSCKESRTFFSGNSFYTTSANRMARKILPNAILASDIIAAIGGETTCVKEEKVYDYKPEAPLRKEREKPHLTSGRLALGLVFILCFAVSMMIEKSAVAAFSIGSYALQAASIVFVGLGTACIFPQKILNVGERQTVKDKRRLADRTHVSAFLILLLIPLTIFFGIYYLGDRKYYFISLLIILEILLPFCLNFEKRKPQARELVAISVLCAIAVAGRTAFFMLPAFKPVAALVIISGICFGGETGFLVGAISGFVSNFYFGQGPWTPWQMFAFGLIGFVAGVLFKKGFLLKTRLSLSAFGFFATLILYGGIMNPASVLMMTATPAWDMIKAAFIMGLPIDLVHASSSAFFLWFISEPMIEKLERIKVKYGLIER